MGEEEKLNILGKKVFFLHPSAVVQNQVISGLIQEEFELYILKDEKKLKQALEHYPYSIFFASINEVMRETAWDELIRDVLGKTEIYNAHVGIIAAINDEIIKQKYLEKYKVQCGFTVVKSDHAAAITQLVDILNGANAKGRRKFIRIATDKEVNTTVNLPINGTFVNGTIKDISVVGFSCSFTDELKLAKNALIGDIQLRLQTQLFKAEGIVFGSRMEGEEQIYVFLFSQRVDPAVRTKIRKFIQSNLQNKMDQELK